MMSGSQRPEHGKFVFLLKQLRERLWVKPLMLGLLSVGAVFAAGLAAQLPGAARLPDISAASIETLLKIISSSMLVIAMFAVGAMLAAYASASNTATPRSFPVVLADDVSQNALSTFIGAFIFSLMALVASTNDYFDKPGRFAIFVLTLLVFAVVILSFVRWVDRIARLGRLGSTIDKLEAVAERALLARRRDPTMGAQEARQWPGGGTPVYAQEVGHVQYIEPGMLQTLAEEQNLHILVTAPPGAFAWPDRPLAHVLTRHGNPLPQMLQKRINNAFVIGHARTFDEDPRFGLAVLSEIASRALSPGVNDPGTAIDVIHTLTRLFTRYARERPCEDLTANRLFVPELPIDQCFDDAFNAIARDGAGLLEVSTCLQKALQALSSLEAPMHKAAISHGLRARRHSEKALSLTAERQALAQVSAWLNTVIEPTSKNRTSSPAPE